MWQQKLIEIPFFNQIIFSDQDRVQKLVLKYYSTQTRYYHNILHVSEMLNWFQQLHEQWENPKEVYLAILFHDIVYDIFQKHNERESVKVALKHLQKYCTDEDVDFSLVERLIILTAYHYKRNIKDLTSDQKLFMDIDNSIFCAGRERLLQYDEAIKQEYLPRYPLAVYLNGRKQFFNDYLSRQCIFRSKFFQDHYEKAAKANLEFLFHKLQQELAALGQ